MSTLSSVVRCLVFVLFLIDIVVGVRVVIVCVVVVVVVVSRLMFVAILC